MAGLLPDGGGAGADARSFFAFFFIFSFFGKYAAEDDDADPPGEIGGCTLTVLYATFADDEDELVFTLGHFFAGLGLAGASFANTRKWDFDFFKAPCNFRLLDCIPFEWCGL